MADHRGYDLTYDAFIRPLLALAVLPLAAALIALPNALEGQWLPVLVLGVLGAVSAWRGAVRIWWSPQEVTLHGRGLILWARRRQVGIAWADLESVTWRRGRNGSLKWRYAGGHTVTSSDRFANIHGLLADVASLAPHADVPT